MTRVWLALAAVFACGGEPTASYERAQQAVLYGMDSRLELYEQRDERWRSLGERSVAALVDSSRFSTTWAFCGDAGAAAFLGATAGQRRGLCTTERFSDQPVIANCGATLIDDDLIITARHCVDSCSGTVFVFGAFYEAEGRLRPTTRDDVYACSDVVLASPDVDVVIVRLDRPVQAPWRPAAIATSLPVVNDAIGVIGFPMGVPMKTSALCNVKSAFGTAFRHNCDVNAGNSGSGTFTSSGQLFGIVSTAPGDFRPGPNGCLISVQYDDEGRSPTFPSAPQLTTSHAALETIAALCATGWPSERLCGKSVRCGDGVCSANEACALDCAAPLCGDGVCTRGEQWRCSDDCGTRMPAVCDAIDAGLDAGAEVDAGVHEEVPVVMSAPPACGCSATPAILFAALPYSLRRRARIESRR